MRKDKDGRDIEVEIDLSLHDKDKKDKDKKDKDKKDKDKKEKEKREKDKKGGKEDEKERIKREKRELELLAKESKSKKDKDNKDKKDKDKDKKDKKIKTDKDSKKDKKGNKLSLSGLDSSLLSDKDRSLTQESSFGSSLPSSPEKVDTSVEGSLPEGSPLPGYTKPYDYLEDSSDPKQKGKALVGAFSYENKDKLESPKDENGTPTGRRATGLAFNYAPGEAQKVAETAAEKRKFLSDKSGNEPDLVPVGLRTPGLDYVESAVRKEQAKSGADLSPGAKRALDMKGGGIFRSGKDSKSGGEGGAGGSPGSKDSSILKSFGKSLFGSKESKTSAKDAKGSPETGKDVKGLTETGKVAKGLPETSKETSKVAKGLSETGKVAKGLSETGKAVKGISETGKGQFDEGLAGGYFPYGSGGDSPKRIQDINSDFLSAERGSMDRLSDRTPVPAGGPKIVKTTTKQSVVKDREGVTQNIEEKVEDLLSGEVTVSTQVNKVCASLLVFQHFPFLKTLLAVLP